MTRKLKEGVLEAYCKYAEHTEVPSRFALWSGLATIAAVLGRDCFIDFGFYTVFPNTYIILVAKSARCRKSTSVQMASFFLNKVKPPVKILAQKMTPEALISSLGGLNKKEGDETSGDVLVIESVGSIIADELITFIDKNAFLTGMVTILTKLYDCTDFDYETKSRGREEIINPCLTIHGGCTLMGIKESIPAAAIGGGFTSRVIFVYLENRDRDVWWPVMTTDNKKREEKIVHDLCEVAKMRGAFGLSDGAKKVFESEYSRFNKNSKLFDLPSMSGYAGRRHTNLLKVCMLISASERDTRIISEKDVGIAINALVTVESQMSNVLNAVTREFVGEVTHRALEIIIRHKIIERPELVKLMSGSLSVAQLDVVINTLMESKVITTIHSGRKITYKFIGQEKL